VEVGVEKGCSSSELSSAENLDIDFLVGVSLDTHIAVSHQLFNRGYFLPFFTL
jgi:hypothetical protein